MSPFGGSESADGRRTGMKKNLTLQVWVNPPLLRKYATTFVSLQKKEENTTK